MGREYFGDITGKFAFGLQKSTDILELVPTVMYYPEYGWIGCRCLVDDTTPCSNFCEDCYARYEDHVHAVKSYLEVQEEEKDDVSEKENISPSLSEETGNITFTLHKADHLDILLQQLSLLELELPRVVINELSKIQGHPDIVNGYSAIFHKIADHDAIKTAISNDQNLWEYYHRYVLGLQIRYVLLHQDTCFVRCET